MRTSGEQLTFIDGPDLSGIGLTMGEPELILSQMGYHCIMGVDEVGRGPLAGNVVSAAVVLPAPLPAPLRLLDDSKKLSSKKRESLFKVIMDHALAIGLAEVEPCEIDRINILQATFKAMRQSVSIAAQRLSTAVDILLVDGKHKVPGVGMKQTSLINGDARSYAVAAASIVAKVTRDQQMRVAHAKYPQYGFDRHKGYGTEAHRIALAQYGPSPLHRRSFKWRAVQS